MSTKLGPALQCARSGYDFYEELQPYNISKEPKTPWPSVFAAAFMLALTGVQMSIYFMSTWQYLREVRLECFEATSLQPAQEKTE
ncbi:hypothetical protein TELCIR_04425 [Teladorsagia circumcincta]|uniref:Uncharacterized protein n=1 Tax=Teladorsagia circumcincta TaxID=45464 RepID=A0A2G9UTX2_TELCI|nr:hypothetical protein TELCIR_04425 [Teladorsagia circumcincta]